MEVIRKEVKTYIEKLYCSCGEEMSNDETMLTSYPPLYPHYCPCGKEVKNVRGYCYPRTVYEK